MSATATADATTENGSVATATPDQQGEPALALGDGPSDKAADAGQDQSKVATLLTAEPEKAEPAKEAAPVVPEAYEIALPKESPVNPDVLAKVTELAKGLSVTDSKAVQGLVDLIHGEADAVKQATLDALKKGGPLWTEHVERLAADALSDKDIGGTPERLAAHVGKAQAVLKQFGDAKFAEMLDETGYGSHPALIKLLARVNDALGEDRVIQGEPPKPKPKSAAQAIYPDLPSVEG